MLKLGELGEVSYMRLLSSKFIFYEIDINFEVYNQRFRKFFTDSKGKIFGLVQTK